MNSIFLLETANAERYTLSQNIRRGCINPEVSDSLRRRKSIKVVNVFWVDSKVTLMRAGYETRQSLHAG